VARFHVHKIYSSHEDTCRYFLFWLSDTSHLLRG